MSSTVQYQRIVFNNDEWISLTLSEREVLVSLPNFKMTISDNEAFQSFSACSGYLTILYNQPARQAVFADRHCSKAISLRANDLAVLSQNTHDSHQLWRFQVEQTKTSNKSRPHVAMAPGFNRKKIWELRSTSCHLFVFKMVMSSKFEKKYLLVLITGSS